MFLAWMEANKKYPEGRTLTYAEFPTKFTWKDGKFWEPRKSGYSIGRLFFVAPGSGEMYYLRCLLNVVRGATCYEDIKRVDGIQYDSFRDACYVRGLLQDDREYVDGILEASQWASAHTLRSLFVTLLSSESMSRAEFVWNNCWKQMSDDILYRQRRLVQHEGISAR